MKLIIALLVGTLLVSACPPDGNTQTQSGGSSPNNMNYKVGQVWTMAPLDHVITVTILGTDDVHRVGKVVHVRVDQIPWQSCGDVHLTRAIEHLAISEPMMRKSGLTLSKDNVSLPDSSIQAYRQWKEQKKHEVIKVPLQKALSQDSHELGPMICNFVPSQT